ncbi:MAG: hypothetical protein K9J06_15005 [Flavobacteriales bacterium]|nr:hypothetical protein [Flavobacteriales bacterium]
MKRIIPLLLLAMAFGQDAAAQFIIDGQFRPRAEYLHGFGSLADSVKQEGATFVDQRTRLNFRYKSKLVNAYISIQDIRTWGSTGQANREDNFLSLNQAWAEAMLGKGFSIKFGRQQLNYDDARIFGDLDWAQQARSHDLLLFKYEDSTLFVHAGAAYNQESVPRFFSNSYNQTGNYKTLQFLWAHKDFKHGIGLSLLFLNNGVQIWDTDTAGNKLNYRTPFSQTAGGRFTYKSKFVDATANFYYQLGTAANDRKLNALNALVELEAKPIKKFGILLGYEALSGTGQVIQQATDNHSFTPFYGTNHKFNGFMDYFYVGNHLNNVGLHNAYVRFIKKGRFFVSLDGHAFFTYADLLDKQWLASSGERRAVNPYLGIELDLTMRYRINDLVTVQGGYSHMFATESMETLKGGSRTALNQWAYLMINVTPTLFNSEKFMLKEK